MGDIISQGQSQLSELVDQRGRIKGVKTVLLNMMTTLGVTNTTMRVIERRDITDYYLVLACMFVVLVLLYVLYLR